MTQYFFYIFAFMKEKDLPIITQFDVDQFVPGQSVDCVIFGFEDRELKI